MKNNNLIIVGLGSIGSNLAEYLIKKNYNVKVWDKDVTRLKQFSKINKVRIEKEFSKNFVKNTIVILTINAGKNVDNFFNKNLIILKKSKYLVDLGNNHPDDTLRRYNFLKKQKIRYINPGFSGGVEGAKGKASLMISCNKQELSNLADLFSKISGHKKKFLKLVGKKPHSGNYVKIVHNSIEYAILQSIADYYFILKKLKKFSDTKILKEILYIEKKINNFYLLSLLKQIIKQKTDLNKIIDKVDDNNTGAWASRFSMKYKFSNQILHAALEARYLSKAKRFIKPLITNNSKINLRQLTESLILIIKFSYIQGFSLLDRINKTERLSMNIHNVIFSWKYNSIIRSDFLKEISSYLRKEKNNFDKFYKKFFPIKDVNSFMKVMQDLSKRNLYPISFVSLSTWLFYNQKQHYDSFSLIQKMRNIFGNHKIRLKH